MGLIYHPTESQGLVSALNTNIATAQEMIDKLNQASQHLIEALSGNELSGAAYTAGKGLFSELILPTISKASEALQKVKSDAKQYEGFASSAGSEILDEDKLNEQLETLRTQQSALTSQINFYNQQAALHPENSELNTSYGDFSTQLSSYMGTNAHDIQKVQEKLQKLHEFNSHVSSLFNQSKENWQSVLTLLGVLNQSSINSKTGQTSLPGGLKFKEIQDFIKEKGTDVGKEKIIDIAKEGLQGQIIKAGADKADNIYNNRYRITDAEGNILGKTPGATKTAIEGVERSSKTLAKYGGEAFSDTFGTLVGVGIDTWVNHEDAGEAWGKEMTNTAVTASVIGGIEGGSALLAETALGVALGVTPVGVGFIAGAAIGIGVGLANDYLRDHFKGVKDFEDGVGNAVVSGWNSSVKEVGHVWRNLFG
ncbi:hypothetical protein IAE51_11055 [Lactococcus sp. S64]|uniref:T7SS effector LXG polymorphic toxin n=1 Tax=Lactococcus sp. S64 TaxID=2767459 RepID=UPI001904D302|nr:hypothetical protein [Lactococcus sp. S64]MBK0084431.1 hypothetical protein [Lactococcus sp. S64]